MTENPEEFLKFLKKVVTEKVRHDFYDSCKDHYEQMAVHVYGTKPVKLLERIRPREDDAIRQYRLASYEPTTKAVCGKAISITSKIFNAKLHSIRFGNDDKSSQLNEYRKILKEYTTEEYPVFGSLISYLSKYAFKKMIADPNGIMVVQPSNYKVKPNERTLPIATCYHSDDVWYINSDFVLIHLKEKEESNKKTHYFQVIDKLRIVNFKFCTTNSTKWFYEEIDVYTHKFGELPIWFLGGEYSDTKEGIYQSFFYEAVPFWNMAIADESDVIGAYRNHLHPKLWEFVEDCDFLESDKYPCINGMINHPDGKHTCSACSGTGKRTPKSPYESYQVSKSAFTTENVTSVQIPFGYVTVPTEATKLLEERSKNNLMRGLEALNMDVISNIGENQSGIAKAYDRTELFDFLQKVADQVFDIHLTNIYKYFVKYMFGLQITSPDVLKEIEPEISKPTEFDIFSIGDLTQQLKDAKEASLNPSYTKTLQMEIQNKKFQTHPDLLERLNLTTLLDPLAEVSDDEINLKLQRNSISKESVIIHDNIEGFINRAFASNNDFDDLNYEDQMKILVNYAKEFEKKNRITLDTTIVDGNGESMDTPIDVEAEAKARLKGSVGGVQGLVQIQTSVAQGITDYEAAVTMLFEIYGFDDATARKLLGDKKKLESANDTGGTQRQSDGNSGQQSGQNNEPNE